MPHTLDALLTQAAHTFAAGGLPAWRLTTLLVLGVLGIGCLLLPLFIHSPADRRRATARRQRQRAARRQAASGDGSTFADGQSGLRRGERDWLDSVQVPDELAALAEVPPVRRPPPSVSRWDLPTRPAML